MTTRYRIPHIRVPLVDKDGFVNREWYLFFERMPIVGEVATSAAAGGATALPATPAGYRTETINGAQYLVPYYDVP